LGNPGHSTPAQYSMALLQYSRTPEPGFVSTLTLQDVVFETVPKNFNFSRQSRKISSFRDSP